MDLDLSFDLHALTARLDRSADRILRAEHDLSYRRFVTLVIVAELDAPTQRAVADRLGVSEPSMSRMTGVLVATGLLDAAPDPAGGNRRRLSLTLPGTHMVEQGRELLERGFAALVERSGVPYGEYARYTKQLMSALDNAEKNASR